MSVTNSSYAYDGPTQADGSRMVIETHQCGNGMPNHQFIYYAPSDDLAVFDPSTLLAGRATQINASLAEAEFAATFKIDAAPVLQEQTLVQFLERLWADYSGSGAVNSCQVAWWLLRRLAAGDIADADCQAAANAAMGVDAATWDNFKNTALTAQSNAWSALLAATGS